MAIFSSGHQLVSMSFPPFGGVSCMSVDNSPPVHVHAIKNFKVMSNACHLLAHANMLLQSYSLSAR